jgi:non-heme chloroperoxidase
MNSPRKETLEIVSRLPAGDAQPTPLLFVHGAFTAAWCWDEHFLAWFAAQGYAAHAVSLSGHGHSPGRDRLDSLSIDDYVADVAAAVATLSAPPVLIGHSMGGFVVQRYLERHAVPAALLMCSVPPQGLMGSAFSMMFSKPALMQDMNSIMTGGMASLESLRDALFAQEIGVEDLTRYLRLAQPESHRAMWDMMMFALPSPAQVLKGVGNRRERLLLLGAELDHLIPPSAVDMTARSYGVGSHIFPAMGHGLMLERDWPLVAQRILGWLQETGI